MIVHNYPSFATSCILQYYAAQFHRRVNSFSLHFFCEVLIAHKGVNIIYVYIEQKFESVFVRISISAHPEISLSSTSVIVCARICTRAYNRRFEFS